jgi:hypothetical protein
MQKYARRFIALAGVVVATSAVVYGQSSDTTTKVPFAFAIGTASMPPGTYHVTRLSGQMGVFKIGSERHSAIVFSQLEGSSRGEDMPRLVFYRYADQYFLREIRLPGNTAYSLPKTRAERDAAERMAGRTTPEIVAIRAREK